MSKIKVLLLGFLFFLVVIAASADVFRYKYQAGQQYRILSYVDQQVYINNRFSHRADQINRILVNVERLEGNKAWHTVDYRNSAESRNAVSAYAFDRTYSAEFWRDPQGYYTINPGLFVPTVRNVPVFPDRDLKPGDTWSANGSEVHDLREGFNIPEAFEFPIPVNYRYEGKATFEGKEYDLITIEYNVFFRSPKRYPNALYPTLITGFSKQRLYWDNALGRAYYYDEDYLIMLTLSDGQTVSYEGKANARVVDVVPYDQKKDLEQIRQEVNNLQIQDVTVSESEEGIVLTLERIQFQAESAVLLPSEKLKLDKIAEILKRFPGRDLLISGHTALAGTEASRQSLSEQRASSVAEYLLGLGVRQRQEVMTQGLAARFPIADNATEEGKSRNRRVEITILK